MYSNEDKQQSWSLSSLWHYLLALIVIWTGGIAASLGWNIYQLQQSILDIARTSAITTYEKDVLYRRWVAMKGGVYAPVSKATPANPYLYVHNRDIKTSGGFLLTLINPAYMTRQVNELAIGVYNFQGHITSLNPIRPGNSPDPWELEALKLFERGEKEKSAIETISGKEFFRFMRPFITEKSCLKCHAAQGYKEGDIRGGISVSIPMAPLRDIEQSRIMELSFAHFFLWVIGLIGISIGTRRLQIQTQRREKLEKELLTLSISDPLTGLHNRRGFLSFAEQQLKLATRNKQGALLFFADIDDLKWINDTLGHEEGDKAIIEAASLLKETFRTSDIIARLGGDEFAVLAVNVIESNSEIFTARLQSLIDIRNNQENRKYSLSISAGCSYYDIKNSISIDKLMTSADKLMYEQKQKKKGLLP